jgi:hypothetical protein
MATAATAVAGGVAAASTHLKEKDDENPTVDLTVA